MHRIILVLALGAALAGCATDDTKRADAPLGGKPIVASAKVPKLDPSRKVAEQDCGRALADEVDNVRCR